MKSLFSKLLTARYASRAKSGSTADLAQKVFGWFGKNGTDDAPLAPGVLKQIVTSLGDHQQDTNFLSQVTQLFHACWTVEEVCNVAKNRLQRLSPKLSGALYLMSETDEYLENAMAWGKVQVSGGLFTPDDCWALRCGRPHQVGKGDDTIACRHIDTGQGHWHLCLPLMAQGEAVGVLYLRDDQKRSVKGSKNALQTQNHLNLYHDFAESLSLAVANVRLRESLRQQAVRDSLTGIFNRRYFDETLKRELHRADRAEQSVSLVMLDIDHFKKFNDIFGHDAGDAALRAVGEILQSSTRAGDVACRYGGEEFAIIFPGMPIDVAMARVEALRVEVERRTIHHFGQVLNQITMSAGVAVYPLHARDMDSLVLAADRALYKSKNAGRNQVAMATLPRRKSDAPQSLELVPRVTPISSKNSKEISRG